MELLGFSGCGEDKLWEKLIRRRKFGHHTLCEVPTASHFSTGTSVVFIQSHSACDQVRHKLDALPIVTTRSLVSFCMNHIHGQNYIGTEEDQGVLGRTHSSSDGPPFALPAVLLIFCYCEERA